FMSLLRKAGYYVAWPGKTDFNFDPADPKAATFAADPPAGSFDSRANWLEVAPPRQPFFAYLNLGVTHESQVRGDAGQHAKNTARLKPGEFHDPAKMKIPLITLTRRRFAKTWPSITTLSRPPTIRSATSSRGLINTASRTKPSSCCSAIMGAGCRARNGGSMTAAFTFH